MATYANRTCNQCGIRKPQPQMYQREVYVETAKSQTGVSAATWVGVFSGDKRSGNQVRNWMFNNGQRTYKRKKQVWMCGVCCGVEKPAKKVAVEVPKAADATTDIVVSAPKQGMSTAAKWGWGFVALVVFAGVFGENDKKRTTTSPSTTATQASP